MFDSYVLPISLAIAEERAFAVRMTRVCPEPFVNGAVCDSAGRCVRRRIVQATQNGIPVILTKRLTYVRPSPSMGAVLLQLVDHNI